MLLKIIIYMTFELKFLLFVPKCSFFIKNSHSLGHFVNQHLISGQTSRIPHPEHPTSRPSHCPNFHIPYTPHLKHSRSRTSHIPHPKHLTSQTSHILHIPHPQYPTFSTSHIPNISHPIHPIFPTPHILYITHPQHSTS